MWDLPAPGLEPVSPALAGGFLTTAPPGKPSLLVFNINIGRKINANQLKMKILRFGSEGRKDRMKSLDSLDGK